MQHNRFLLHQLLPIPTCYQSYSCNVWGLKLMHKNWVLKRYDQSVTCLADDWKTLEIRSSKPRTPETLSWTNNSIHKHSTIRCKGKTKRTDLNRKFKWRASICKKNQSNRTYETQTTIKTSSRTNLLETKFYISKIMFKLFIWTEGVKTKILALVSLDLDKRAKSNEGLKIRD